MSFAVISFYKFHALTSEELEAVRSEISVRCGALGIKGLVVLAAEGINSTLAGPPDSIETFKTWLRADSVFAPIECKDSVATKEPFRRLRIDVRPEIVTWGHPVAAPEIMQASFLSPEEWHARFQEKDPPISIDFRNTYETRIGKFRGAIDPCTDVFTDLPEFIEKAGLPKDREILTYCTGGIRCEKALGYLHGKGYKIRQLSGGILKYLEKFPNGAFEGECFVFDHRVAVDKHLEPSSTYALCPHCGDPGDLLISCARCGKERKICASCNREEKKFCSKDCAHRTQPVKRQRVATSA